MTKDQTRQLGIEFERRLNTMFPETALNKLNTDAIYSFLSEYQLLYVKQLILADGQLESGSKASDKINDTLKDLVSHIILSDTDKVTVSNANIDNNCIAYKLPTEYFMYIRSTSILKKDYKSNSEYEEGYKYISNISAKQQDINSIINNFNDENKIIRHPVVTVEGESIKVFIDRYTKLSGIDLVYYKLPHPFNIINYNDTSKDVNSVKSTCSLPYSCFEEFVSGALMAYGTYKTNVALNKNQAERDAIKNITGNNSATKEAKQ